MFEIVSQTSLYLEHISLSQTSLYLEHISISNKSLSQTYLSISNFFSTSRTRESRFIDHVCKLFQVLHFEHFCVERKTQKLNWCLFYKFNFLFWIYVKNRGTTTTSFLRFKSTMKLYNE